MVSSEKATFVWSLNIVILAYGVSSSDVIGLSANHFYLGNSLIEADGVLLEKHLEPNSRNCTGLTDSCQNGGSCVNGTCQCFSGTHGDWCEVVDGCLDYFGNPNCGAVPCEFNVTSKEPYCHCKEPGYLFDSINKICKECDCGTHGSCFFLDNIKTCNCEEGYAEKPAGQFSRSQCEQCDCGPDGTCSFDKGGGKVCDCQKGYLDKNGYCIECDCGPNGDCSIDEEGKKVCSCREGYSDKNAYCVECDCGEKSSGCSFQNDKKVCSCYPSYIQFNGTCIRNCTDSCQNGGKCVNDACQCLSGTQGDWCEVVDGCLDYFGNPNCGAVPCEFNVTSKEPYCYCKEPGYLFDSINKICRECDCGKHGSCFFLDNKKTCNCDEGYVENPFSQHGRSQCEQCYCGPNGECAFVEGGNKICNCQSGYLDKNGYCTKCDCGPHGYCSFDGKGRTVCDCQKGYSNKNGYCAECDCGPNGICSFHEEEKVCDCRNGYSDKNGYCTECDCGPYGECVWDDFGEKMCNCREGYEVKDGKCTDIDECVEQTKCPRRDTTECINTQGSYYCVCKTGYSPKASIETEGCQKDQNGWSISPVFLILIVLFVNALGLIMAFIKRRFYNRAPSYETLP